MYTKLFNLRVSQLVISISVLYRRLAVDYFVYDTVPFSTVRKGNDQAKLTYRGQLTFPESFTLQYGPSELTLKCFV